MRTTLLILPTATALVFTACDKQPATGSGPPAVIEADAFAGFKRQLQEIGQWMTVERARAGNQELASQPAVAIELFSRLKAVKSDDLPGDLKSAWGEFVGVMGEMADLMKTLTADKSKKVTWEFMAEMKPFMKKLTPIGAKLDEVFQKHGIEVFSTTLAGRIKPEKAAPSLPVPDSANDAGRSDANHAPREIQHERITK